MNKYPLSSDRPQRPRGPPPGHRLPPDTLSPGCPPAPPRTRRCCSACVSSGRSRPPGRTGTPGPRPEPELDGAKGKHSAALSRGVYVGSGYISHSSGGPSRAERRRRLDARSVLLIVTVQETQSWDSHRGVVSFAEGRCFAGEENFLCS
ncbi:hypothetical protein EYF80_060150 [Liparis tanakae]|uniref:Uncharacterized protein n=1 Tax=Liparis tanakae TaxID=230148 RepID=A0A4Z2EMA7_9TELE|nr:hypothetical protein EYF80_060150 [Liparis tanakae]